MRSSWRSWPGVSTSRTKRRASRTCWGAAARPSRPALVGLTRAAATEWAADGITVNAVAPSVIRTAGTQVAPEEALAQTARAQAIKRTPEPDDLARVVAFLASDDAAS